MGFRDGVPNRIEVGEKISNMGDYVKMDYLQRVLKMEIDFDTRKFVLTRLAEVYEPRGMFGDAAKLMSASAEINTTYEGKMSDFMKSAELYIKSGKYDESDIAYGKALGCANEIQKVSLKAKRKEAIKKRAEELIKKDKRAHAMLAYEKLLTLELNVEEKRKAKEALVGLYEKLGKIREYNALKNSI